MTRNRKPPEPPPGQPSQGQPQADKVRLARAKLLLSMTEKPLDKEAVEKVTQHILSISIPLEKVELSESLYLRLLGSLQFYVRLCDIQEEMLRKQQEMHLN